MALYDEWQAGKISGHVLTSLLSSYHRGQITGQEAVAIMNARGLSQSAQDQIVILYNKLVAQEIDRDDLDDALHLGENRLPGFANEQQFLVRLGIT